MIKRSLKSTIPKSMFKSLKPNEWEDSIAKFFEDH